MWLVRGCRGFTVVEALVASLLAATAIVLLVHLAAIGTAQTLTARRASNAHALAQAKLEELRARPWTYAADGSRVNGLAYSPPSALVEDAEGFFDELDRFGAQAPGGEAPHLRRRWSVLPLAPADEDTLVLQACVFAPEQDGRAMACVWTIRTRRP